MTDKQIQNRLNKLMVICNDLNAEAVRRYGPHGNLFFESDGDFHLMAGDCEGPPSERQKYIRFSSSGHCQLGAGAW